MIKALSWLSAQLKAVTILIDPVIRIENLQKTFGGNQVLRGVSIDISAGEIVVIIGASGSGKTTLLCCLNRLEEPTGGVIWLDGVSVGGTLYASSGKWQAASEKQAAEQRSQFGFVFQRFNLFPHLTARDNVAIGLEKVRRMLRAAIRRATTARRDCPRPCDETTRDAV